MLAMKAFKGAGWLVFSRFIGRSIDFITLLILARYLSPDDFGLMALAMTLIAIVDTVLELPATQALTRLKEIDKAHLDTGFTLGVMRSALIAVVVLAAAWPFSIFYQDGRLFELAAVLMIGSIARGFYSPAMAVFVRDISFSQVFLAELGGKICAFILVIATALMGGGYWALVANYVVASIGASIVSYVIAPYRPALSLKKFADFSTFVGWFTAIQVVSAINWQFDRVVLGRFVDKASLGRYAVGSDLAVMPTQSLIGPAMQPVMAAFARINDEPDRLQNAFLRAVRFAMLLSVPAALGIALTADLVVAVVLGPKWDGTAPFLQLFALAVLPIPYYQTLYSFSLAVDRPVVLFRINLLDLGVRVLLIGAGLYLWSIMGVAVARVLIATLMLGVYVAYARRLCGVAVTRQLANLWKVVVAAFVMAIAVLAFRHVVAPLHLNVLVELFATAALGAAAYAGTLWGLGVWLIFGQGRLQLVDRWW